MDNIANSHSWIWKLSYFGLRPFYLSFLWAYKENKGINALRPEQCDGHFAGNIFVFGLKFHFFYPKGPINNKLALVQVMAWSPTDDKPVSESNTDQDLYRHLTTMGSDEWVNLHGCQNREVRLKICNPDEMWPLTHCPQWQYRKTSNIRRTLVGNIIVDHSDEVGAAPVGAAPTTSSFST